MSNFYTGIVLSILFTLYASSCIGTQPAPEDRIPQCCGGQESHTCDMPDMAGKPLEK